MVLGKVISRAEIEILEAYGKKIKGRREYRRLQSILLRAKEGKSAEEIAQILGINPRTVQKHHRRYFEEGLKAFDSNKPGPRGPRLLNFEEEAALLESLKEQAAKGQVLKAGQIKPLYEEKAGRPCSLGTIYVVLKRNRWNKKQPRPRHPKGDEEGKSLFKKTTRNPQVDC